MHEIDPLAYVAQHENHFGTCNTNNSLQKLKSCTSLQKKFLVELTFYAMYWVLILLMKHCCYME